MRAIYEKMQSEADLSVAEGETLFERYVQEDPLDERVYLRMMEIYESAHLYYKGIRLYQQLVNLLNTELRVAPRREIRELYRKLLHVWSEEGEKEEEHSGEVCTGRERELQLLQASYRQFLSGSPTSVLLSGKSGVGKTIWQSGSWKRSQRKTQSFYGPSVWKMNRISCFSHGIPL